LSNNSGKPRRNRKKFIIDRLNTIRSRNSRSHPFERKNLD